MAKLTSYLYSLGHRRLGFLAHHATLGPVNERQTSVVAAARRHQGVLVATAADADSLEGGVAPLARCWMPCHHHRSCSRCRDFWRVSQAPRCRHSRDFLGLSAADSWLNRGRMNYPLLWDRQRQHKPAFDAVVEVLRSDK